MSIIFQYADNVDSSTFDDTIRDMIKDYIKEIIHAASDQLYVTTVSLMQKEAVRLQNIKWLITAGNDDNVLDVNDYHKEGITGNNVYISVTDSGLDVNHEQFIDNDNDVPFDTYNDNHRKIYNYISTEATDKTDTHGHGTRIASILAGQTINSNDATHDDSGIVVDSKIVVVDLHDDVVGFNSPSDMMNDYVDPMSQNNVDIHSISWDCFYDDQYNPFYIYVMNM